MFSKMSISEDSEPERSEHEFIPSNSLFSQTNLLNILVVRQMNKLTMITLILST